MSNDGSRGHPSGRPYFRHTALDRKENSMRLVKVLPNLSTDGLVECSMYRTKLSPGAADGATDVVETQRPDTPYSSSQQTPYVCLSYMWGSPRDEGAILIDGTVLMVRKNLETFLHVARKQLGYCFLWIDALCIDQANAAERDHQVQRMGTIFAKAKMLITWLGCKPELERPLHLLGLGENQTQWAACMNFYQRERHKITIQDYVSLASGTATPSKSAKFLKEAETFTFYVALADHEYWRRAWVTQEIMLAKAIYIVAGNAILDYPSLVNFTRCCVHVYSNSHFEQFARLMLVQKDYFERRAMVTGRVLISDSWMNNWGLVNLLHHFENKSCTIRRDMVYSVLSLSREAETLKVNYQSPMSEVMWQIMNICEDSLCLCTVAVLVRALGQDSFADTEPRLRISALFVNIPMLGFPLKHVGSITKCPFCEGPLHFAGRSGIELMFCLITACKDSEGHMYKELDFDGCHLLTLESFSERTLRTLGKFGEGVEIIKDDNSNICILKFSFPPLLKTVGGPQWSRTLRQRSCGNMWPDMDRPNMERLSICTA